MTPHREPPEQPPAAWRYWLFTLGMLSLGGFCGWLCVAGLISGRVLARGSPPIQVMRAEDPLAYWISLIPVGVVGLLLVVIGLFLAWHRLRRHKRASAP